MTVIAAAGRAMVACQQPGVRVDRGFGGAVCNDPPGIQHHDAIETLEQVQMVGDEYDLLWHPRQQVVDHS